MASKICVPCDFGIQNMYDPFHGNVNIEFADETKIKVNSLILSWNSATFCYFFNELRLENVEIKDFTKEAVILYLESLYLVNGEIDAITRSLLSDSQIVKCLADNPDIYEDMFELLAIKSGNDFKMLSNLTFSVIKATRSPSRTLSKQVVPVKEIPNLFHDFEVFKELSDDEILQKLSSMQNISILMVVELCYIIQFKGVRDKVLQNISQIFASKSLCRVPSRFIQSFRNPGVLSKLPQSVISEDGTAVIEGTETTLIRLLTTSELYKLYFQYPAAPQCEKHTECGFMLQLTPFSKEEAGKYNIQLVTEESEYPADIHCHSEVISAAHMHLVIEWDYCGRWCTNSCCNSWRGKPEYSEKRGGVEWGGVSCNNNLVRFVVYYDIRDSK